jgi:hypothetical protein
MLVPLGWEARGVSPPSRGCEPDGSVAYPYVHLASVPMGPSRAPFGNGVVEHLGDLDGFVALLEFAPSSAGSPLFSEHEVPHRLRAVELSSACLQRTIKGQLGWQRFFRAHGRAFCCYVVLGSRRAVTARLPDVNRVLSSLTVHGASS